MKLRVVMYLILVLMGSMTTKAALAQEMMEVSGTIGRDKMDEGMIAICVFGTQACMTVYVDTSMRVAVLDEELPLAELPVGLYVEAVIEQGGIAPGTVKSILVDPSKTIFCFKSLTEKEQERLEHLFEDVDGIKDVTIYEESKQAMIEYDPEVISYPEIESKIVGAEFSVE